MPWRGSVPTWRLQRVHPCATRGAIAAAAALLSGCPDPQAAVAGGAPRTPRTPRTPGMAAVPFAERLTAALAANSDGPAQPKLASIDADQPASGAYRGCTACYCQRIGLQCPALCQLDQTPAHAGLDQPPRMCSIAVQPLVSARALQHALQSSRPGKACAEAHRQPWLSANPPQHPGLVSTACSRSRPASCRGIHPRRRSRPGQALPRQL